MTRSLAYSLVTLVEKTMHAFLDLIDRFLKADILDREGVNYACAEVGIPQGSPVSPVLMNVFLHSFDQIFSSLKIVQPGGPQLQNSNPLRSLRRQYDLRPGQGDV
jgi:hypothetical protein